MITGTNGRDVLIGGPGDDILVGLDGNDLLDGRGGVDRTEGGAGDDHHYVDHHADEAIEKPGEGIDSVYASVGYTLRPNIEFLILTGAAPIGGYGNELDNVLVGNDADNIVDGGAGGDQMKGGGGNDRYHVDDLRDRALETSADGGVDHVYSSVNFALGAWVENLTLTGAASVWAVGNELDNIITGNAGANLINGGLGGDRMTGGAGNDTYVVDNAGDRVIETSASDGIDLVKSSISFTLGAHVEHLELLGAGDLYGIGNDLDNTIVGNSGANQLNGGLGADVMRGGAGDDTYFVDDVRDRAVETSAAHGHDRVKSSVSFWLGTHIEDLILLGGEAIDGTGNELDNILTGNAAANVLNGAGGADTMKGGAGDDTYFVDHAGDKVIEFAGQGTDLVRTRISFALWGHVENLQLDGTDAINGTGNDLANAITGNAAANLLDGSGGADVMKGNHGDDTYIVDDVGDQVVETSPVGGIDLVRSSVSFTLGNHVENLTLTGAAAIDGTGNGLANVLIGNAAANRLDGGGGADRMEGGAGNDSYVVDHAGDVVVESAGNGTDTVLSSVGYALADQVENLTLTGGSAIDGTGNGLANVLIGNAAANRLDGGGGADRMEGAAGNDSYVVDHAGDVVVESAGNGTDTVLSSVGYALGDHVENLTLTGGSAIDGTGNGLANVLIGNAAANRLDGGAGADRMEGGAGNDSYVVDHAGDVVVEGAGNGTDTVLSSVGYALGDHVENLTLTGGSAIDGTGNGLANVLTGNGAANVLNGGGGADRLEGGGGSDRFEFTTALGAGNVDTIVDFAPGVDRIVLGGFAGQPFAALATGALAGFAFRAGSAAADADDRLIYNAATGALLYDADGVGGAAAVQFATLAPGLSLSAADFVVSGPPNNAPTITSGGTASVEENIPTSTIVYQTAAQDADGDAIFFRLSGTDASRFTIDQTGAVRFVTSPDFETKSSYLFSVEAVDSSGVGAVRSVTLTITDVAENVGPYLVSEKSDANDSIGTAQALDRTQFSVTDDPDIPDDSLPSAKITGAVAAGGDRDFYSVTLKAGELLVLDVDGTTSLDAFVRVYDASGVQLTFNDDQVSFDPGSSPQPGISHNLDSLVKVRAPADGTYYFSIASYPDQSGQAPSSSGGYTINVSIGPPATRQQIDEENVQALMSGSVWSSLNLTYSFPSDGSDYPPGEGTDEIQAGMMTLNLTQRGAVRTMLGQIENLTGLGFTELVANPGLAQLRYAQSNDPATAHAYYPGPGNGGDSWYNTMKYGNPTLGNYQYMTFLHETGHALGLKHGHEAPALSPDRDSMEYSVMTYRSYIGDSLDDGGYRNETWGFAQTLMMYDIAALQRMYGADFDFNAGNTVYNWDPNTGAFVVNLVTKWTPGGNRVFMTLWDGGGNDTYNLSNYNSSVTIDLRPGEWTITSTVQLANLGDGNFARGNVANALLHNGDTRSLIENAVGGSSGDVLIGNQAVNRLTGGSGDDLFRLMSPEDSRPGSADIVTDFLRGTDKIDLSFLDARTDLDGLNRFAFIGTNAFSTPADSRGQVRYETVGNDVHVFGDVDADGIADFQLILQGVTALGSADFLFA